MKLIYYILFLFAVNIFYAQFSVAPIFSNNMVMQRNVKIPVWGWAKPNEKVIVTFYHQTKSSIADASECNLFNIEGFPLAPFRTDDWKTITKDVHYKITIQK